VKIGGAEVVVAVMTIVVMVVLVNVVIVLVVGMPVVMVVSVAQQPGAYALTQRPSEATAIASPYAIGTGESSRRTLS